MLEEILTTARDDEQLKSLVELWGPLFTEHSDPYLAFQNSIDELLAEDDTEMDDSEIDGAETDDTDDSPMTFRVWTDPDDHCTGFRLSISEQPLLTWQKTVDGDKKGIYLALITDNGEDPTLEGTETASGSFMNGDFRLSSSGEEVADIKMENYDLSSAEEGRLNATYTIVPIAQSQDDEEASLLQNMRFVLDISNPDQTSVELELSLMLSGSKVGSLRISGSTEKQMELPDLNNLGKVYDTELEEDQDQYLEEANTEVLLDNLRAAGMPEELVEQLLASFTESPEETDEETPGTTEEMLVDDPVSDNTPA